MTPVRRRLSTSLPCLMSYQARWQSDQCKKVIFVKAQSYLFDLGLVRFLDVLSEIVPQAVESVWNKWSSRNLNRFDPGNQNNLETESYSWELWRHPERWVPWFGKVVCTNLGPWRTNQGTKLASMSLGIGVPERSSYFLVGSRSTHSYSSALRLLVYEWILLKIRGFRDLGALTNVCMLNKLGVCCWIFKTDLTWPAHQLDCAYILLKASNSAESLNLSFSTRP